MKLKLMRLFGTILALENVDWISKFKTQTFPFPDKIGIINPQDADHVNECRYFFTVCPCMPDALVPSATILPVFGLNADFLEPDGSFEYKDAADLHKIRNLLGTSTGTLPFTFRFRFEPAASCDFSRFCEFFKKPVQQISTHLIEKNHIASILLAEYDD